MHGIHVVAEAPGNDYKWTSRISWLTGLPTPIGWRYHQSQQRRAYGASLEARIAAMTELYTTTDVHVMANVLSRVLGPVSRLRHAGAAARVTRQRGGAALVRVLERGDRRRPLDGGWCGQRRTVRCGRRRIVRHPVASSSTATPADALTIRY